MILRIATDADSDYFFALRADPTAALMSRRLVPTRTQHDRWWHTTHDLKYVAIKQNIGYDSRIGTVRVGKDGAVSIVVDPNWRGLGYGPMMLDALSPLAKAEGYDTLLAEIAYDNVRSQRAFAKAKWRPVLWEAHI
jgi:GNAT superfamily N-acetyltransferase